MHEPATRGPDRPGRAVSGNTSVDRHTGAKLPPSGCGPQAPPGSRVPDISLLATGAPYGRHVVAPAPSEERFATIFALCPVGLALTAEDGYVVEVNPALARLLGPAGPELGCDECFEQLDRYVELELAGADADAAVPGLRAHLDGCPACREEHESLYALARGDSAR